MLTLVLVGLVGGLITGISPCVLPVLPVVLVAGGAGSARSAGEQPGADPERLGRRPFLVVAGLALGFAGVTLLGTLLLSALPLPDDVIRWAGLVVLVLLGLGMIVPAVERVLERPFSRLPMRRVDADGNGFLLGLALGTVYVPCAGPVLAAITVAGATGHIGWPTVALTLAFALGTSVPLLVFALAGRRVAERVRAFRVHQRAVRVVAGVTVIALAVALTFNLTDVLQRAVPDYTAALNRVADHRLPRAISGGSADAALAACQADPPPALSDCGPMPAIRGIDAWLNTPDGAAVTRAQLAGKVVLVDFWAYSCINCQRAIPHDEAWWRAYRADGLEVIGVHTPEYAFEHEPGNVIAGTKRLGITYPVALDDQYATWTDFGNDSWPAEYLVDAAGRVRSVAIGEGDYGHTEALIRRLLTAAHPGVHLPPATDVADRTPDNPNQTPELYLGSQRAEGYAGGLLTNGTHRFTEPTRPSPDRFGLGGTWTVGDECLTAGRDATLSLDFDASDVYLDVGGTGTVTATVGGRTSSYVVRGAPDIHTVSHTARAAHGVLTLRLTPGLCAYSFTFG